MTSISRTDWNAGCCRHSLVAFVTKVLFAFRTDSNRPCRMREHHTSARAHTIPNLHVSRLCLFCTIFCASCSLRLSQQPLVWLCLGMTYIWHKCRPFYPIWLLSFASACAFGLQLSTLFPLSFSLLAPFPNRSRGKFSEVYEISVLFLGLWRCFCVA